RERELPELAGGNWLRGKHLFESDTPACHKCHQIGGRGGRVGPDLSNLVHRDLASVLKDIQQPSAAINPDHVAYHVELRDGELLLGVPVGDGGSEVTLADATGQTRAIARSQIMAMRPSNVSLMPEGLIKDLSPQATKDLLSFLLLPAPLTPAPLEI